MLENKINNHLTVSHLKSNMYVLNVWTNLKDKDVLKQSLQQLN